MSTLKIPSQDLMNIQIKLNEYFDSCKNAVSFNCYVIRIDQNSTRRPIYLYIEKSRRNNFAMFLIREDNQPFYLDKVKDYTAYYDEDGNLMDCLRIVIYGRKNPPRTFITRQELTHLENNESRYNIMKG